jgi:formamidopyrimidine-DNA glycosylase
MPELPDLHLFSSNLRRHLAGKTVADVQVFKSKRVSVAPEQLRAALAGARLEDVRREGKEIHLAFSNRQSLGVHLMLKGGFCIAGPDEEVKYRCTGILFDDTDGLFICDAQSLTTLTLNPPRSKVPDALDPAFDLDYLRRQLKRCAGANVKTLLVDQGVVRGIGNAYADEILWQARVAPLSLCGRVPDQAAAQLHRAVGAVLQDAIRQLSALAPDALSGERREFLSIHNPDRERSPGGAPIQVTTIDGRKAYYTGEQTLYG